MADVEKIVANFDAYKRLYLQTSNDCKGVWQFY